MGFRDHFRSAKRTDDRTSSISSSSTQSKHTTGTTTPNPTETTSPLQTIKTATETKSNSPAITLTKTHSRLGLGKTLTWHSGGTSKPSRKEANKDKQLKEWAKEDAVEWTSPMSQRPGKKDKECQNTLRAFDFRKAALGKENEEKGRSLSAASDVSPSASRVGSVDDGLTLGQLGRKSGERMRPGKLSQEIKRGDVGAVETKKMVGVTEE